MSVNEMSVDEMSVNEMSVDKMSVNEWSVGEMVFDQMMWNRLKLFLHFNFVILESLKKTTASVIYLIVFKTCNNCFDQLR